MANASIYSIVSVIIISLVSLIGILTLVIKKKVLNKILFYLVSFAVGALLGDALIHLIPESVENLSAQTASMLVLAGILIFFILEKAIRWHHCHNVECKEEHTHPAGTINLISDSVHNFIDGILIAASFLVDIRLGVTTSLAILLHEIPQEIGDFSILINSGFKIKKAVLFNFLTALFAILGTVLVLVFKSSEALNINYLLPITAGGFLYIASSDLIPELHKKNQPVESIFQVVFLLIGVFIMYGLKFIG
jgi:zinc and cadmium transporter